MEEPEEESNVVDLMAALKASIGRRGKGGKGGGEVVPLRRAPRRASGHKRKTRRKGAA